MSRQEGVQVAPGAVFEFYESREILCGVVLSVKDGRFSALSERNREVSLSQSRIIFIGNTVLDLKAGRDDMLRRLQAISDSRRKVLDLIDLQEVWSLLESEETGYEAEEIAEFIFSTPLFEDQAAAVNRALLSDKLYFQAKDAEFFARSAENVDARRAELQREAEKERKIEEAAKWASAIQARKQLPPIDFRDELMQALKDFALFGQEAKESTFVKEILKLATIPPIPQSAFRILVRIGVWREDENLLLHEYGITSEFPRNAMEEARQIAKSGGESGGAPREDLRELDVFTVDSHLTRDYDDALSIRDVGGGVFEVGVHIADAAELIPKGSSLDREAEIRASSIYLPDERVSMLPEILSEGVLSLKAGEERLAISFLMKIDSNADILETRICPSIVKVRGQLTYSDVDKRIVDDSGLKALYDLAMKLRRKRIDLGAIMLPLPEIQVYVNTAGMIQVLRYEKETPSQVLVSEWMIEANAAAACYLSEKSIPALFRSQAECRPETEFVESEYELFRIYRQRRLFSRAELATEAKPHCSLALSHYVTVTSPIRRYSDLVVQRQLKQALATGEEAYSEEELEALITRLSAAQGRVFTIQRKWSRYWILKYLEQEDIRDMNALVLEKNARFAHLLIPDFLIEVKAPVGENAKFSQGELVRIHIEKALPREDVLKVQVLEAPAR